MGHRVGVGLWLLGPPAPLQRAMILHAEDLLIQGRLQLVIYTNTWIYRRGGCGSCSSLADKSWTSLESQVLGLAVSSFYKLAQKSARMQPEFARLLTSSR